MIQTLLNAIFGSDITDVFLLSKVNWNI